MADRGERLGVELVLGVAGQLVALVGHDRVLAQLAQREVGEHGARGHPLDRVARRDPGEVVAALGRVRLGEHLLDRAERVAHTPDRRCQLHEAWSIQRNTARDLRSRICDRERWGV